MNLLFRGLPSIDIFRIFFYHYIYETVCIDIILNNFLGFYGIHIYFLAQNNPNILKLYFSIFNFHLFLSLFLNVLFYD